MCEIYHKNWSRESEGVAVVVVVGGEEKMWDARCLESYVLPCVLLSEAGVVGDGHPGMRTHISLGSFFFLSFLLKKAALQHGP